MTAPHPRKLVVALTIAVLGWLALGAGASLAASPNAASAGSFTRQVNFSDTVPGDYPCFAGVTGTITGTETISGHYSNAPAFFHFEGTLTQEYRIDFSDGRYVIGGFSTRFADAWNAQSGIPREQYTDVGVERATVYASDGSATGTVTVSGVIHTSWADLNQNGQMDANEFTASVSPRVTCT
jgi:hypothetical protein